MNSNLSKFNFVRNGFAFRRLSRGEGIPCKANFKCFNFGTDVSVSVVSFDSESRTQRNRNAVMTWEEEQDGHFSCYMVLYVILACTAEEYRVLFNGIFHL